MATPKQSSVVTALYERFQHGDVPGILALVHEDVRWRLPEIEHVPQAGERRGRDGVREFFDILGQTQRPMTFEIQSVEQEDSAVIVTGRYEWEVLTTGRVFASDWTHRFELRDGLIVEFDETTDVDAAIVAYRP